MQTSQMRNKLMRYGRRSWTRTEFCCNRARIHRQRWTGLSRSEGIRLKSQRDDEAKRRKGAPFDEDSVQDEELLGAWKSMQETGGLLEEYTPEQKTEAQRNMQAFLETLFHEFSSREKGDFVSKEKLEEVLSDLPSELVEQLKGIGFWDRLPNAGFEPQALDDLDFWTVDEYTVFHEDPNTPPVDDEDEVRKEMLLLSAVRKLEAFYKSFPDDPDEVFNIMAAAKMAFEARVDPFANDRFDNLDIEEEDLEHLIDIDAIEACLKDLEEGIFFPKMFPDLCEPCGFAAGKDAPPPDRTKYTVFDAEPAEIFMERMQLMEDYYAYPNQKHSERKLSKDEYNEIKRRWKEFMPDEEPLYFQEIQHFRLAPDLPDWMEKHFRSLQHITYILRAAHIHSKITEPGKRLHKYNRISPNVAYSDPAVELEGFDEFLAQMQRLEDSGVSTEPSTIFGDVRPPKRKLDDLQIENPWTYTIVVDMHLNLPIPDWYHALLDEHEAQLTEEDLTQSDAEMMDEETFRLMDSIDKVFKKGDKPKKSHKVPVKKKRSKKPPHPSELANKETKDKFDKLRIGVKDADPKLYEPYYVSTEKRYKKKDFSGSGQTKGDFWYEDPVGESWRTGNMITINATVIYKLDITAGQVCDIHMRWGAILGAILAAEDVERIFCELSGVEYEARSYKHDFGSEWSDFEYKPIRKNPIDWFKQQIMGIQQQQE